MLENVKSFIKKESVLCISAMLAVITMFFVPPDMEYVNYIDFRVLCLLMCLMIVVAGFKSVGSFGVLTYQLLRRIRNSRILSFALVMLPFFSSMLVTNDVALIIFVPFTMALLTELGFRKSIVPIIVLQTVAANLGSAATPVGNPQNLFLYSAFNLTIGEFFSASLPVVILSFVFLAISSLFVLKKNMPQRKFESVKISDKTKLVVYVALFIICLLTVFRVIPYIFSTLIIIAVFFITDRKLFKEIDFMLLLTFVCFFIISENLGRIEVVNELFKSFLEKSVLFTSFGASQVISNVPAAVLLSGFTDDWKNLFMGVNIGGLGTPVASLASLITLKFYLKSEKAKISEFLSVFMIANVAGAAILLAFTFII